MDGQLCNDFIRSRPPLYIEYTFVHFTLFHNPMLHNTTLTWALLLMVSILSCFQPPTPRGGSEWSLYTGAGQRTGQSSVTLYKAYTALYCAVHNYLSSSVENTLVKGEVTTHQQLSTLPWLPWLRGVRIGATLDASMTF